MLAADPAHRVLTAHTHGETETGGIERAGFA